MDDADVELGLTMSQLHLKFGDRLKAFGDYFLGGG
jgi:putative transposase